MSSGADSGPYVFPPPLVPAEGYLADLTYEEAAAVLRGGAVALLPLGATEAHGPHLPLHTDVYIAVELAFRVRAALAGAPPALVLPPVTFAVTEFARGFAGTVSIGADVARGLISQVVSGIGRQGARKVALVNAHLEPAHRALLDEIAAGAPDDGPKVLHADCCRKPWALRLSAEFKKGDCHAGAYETSLLLASRYSARVRAERARALPPRWLGLVEKMRSGAASFEAMGATEAYFGDPAAASADEGERLYAALVEMWVQTIRGAGPAA
jgi:creatinine amidohydrolase